MNFARLFRRARGASRPFDRQRGFSPSAIGLNPGAAKGYVHWRLRCWKFSAVLTPGQGGRPEAMASYRTRPIRALDGRTAEALVKSGQARLVWRYLDEIDVGGFA